jgi:hypothetical protein
VGAATLLLPARRFYELRNWYAQKELGRYRARLVRADGGGTGVRGDAGSK